MNNLCEFEISKPAQVGCWCRQEWQITSRLNILFFMLGMLTASMCWNSHGLAQESLVEFKPTSKTTTKFGREFDMLTFVTDGQKLVPVFDPDSQSGRAKFSAIRQAFGNHSGSSSSGGNNWSASVRGDGFQAAVGFGTSREFETTGNRSFWVFVKDTGKSDQVVKTEAKKGGEFSVDCSFDGGESLFRFRQDRKGDVYCQDLSAENVFVGAAKTFDDFCRKNPEYVVKRLEPIFKHIGLGIPPTRYASDVAKNVMINLKPVDPSREKDFQAAIAGMNADRFEDREKATEALKKNFSDWKDLIQTATSDEKVSAEIRSRLQKIYKDSVTEKEVGNFEIAQKGNLEDDASYLIWLLEQSQGEKLVVPDDVQKLIVAKLELLTGEALGDDLAKWQKWLGQNKSSLNEESILEPTMSDAEILTHKAVLEKAQKHIGQLLRLKLHGGRLKVDRNHWAAAFGGKSIKELAETAKEHVRELNLPDAWFKPGGDFSVESTGYPQVLFESMAGEFVKQQEPFRPYYRGRSEPTLNRSFDGNELRGTLRTRNDNEDAGGIRFGIFGGRAKVKPPKEDFFELILRETQKAGNRSLLFKESKDGALLLVFEFPDKDAMIRVIQAADQEDGEKNRFVVFDIRGPAVKTFRAITFSEFKKNQSEYYTTFLEPLLTKFNIVIVEPTSE